MAVLIHKLDVPLTATQIFTLDSGDTITIQAKQASSELNIRRGELLTNTWSPASDNDGSYKVSMLPALYRSMVDAFCASVETDIVDENGDLIFKESLTFTEYRKVWGLTDLDKQMMTWRPKDGKVDMKKYSIRDMIMEVVWRANPTWDPFRDEETDTTNRPLQSYGRKNTK